MFLSLLLPFGLLAQMDGEEFVLEPSKIFVSVHNPGRGDLKWEMYVFPEVTDKVMKTRSSLKDELEDHLEYFAIPYFQKSGLGVGEIEVYVKEWLPSAQEKFFASHGYSEMSENVELWQSFWSDFGVALEDPQDLKPVHKTLLIHGMSRVGLDFIFNSDGLLEERIADEIEAFLADRLERMQRMLELNLSYPTAAIDGASFREVIYLDVALPLVHQFQSYSANEITEIRNRIFEPRRFNQFSSAKEEMDWLEEAAMGREAPMAEELSPHHTKRLAFLYMFSRMIDLSSNLSAYRWTNSDLHQIGELFIEANRGRLRPRAIGSLTETEIEQVARSSTRFAMLKYAQYKREHRFREGTGELLNLKFLGKAAVGGLLLWQSKQIFQAVEVSFIRTEYFYERQMKSNPKGSAAFLEAQRALKNQRAQIVGLEKAFTRRFGAETWNSKVKPLVGQLQDLGEAHQRSLKKLLATQLDETRVHGMSFGRFNAGLRETVNRIRSAVEADRAFSLETKRLTRQMLKQARADYATALRAKLESYSGPTKYPRVVWNRVRWATHRINPRLQWRLKHLSIQKPARVSLMQHLRGDYRPLFFQELRKVKGDFSGVFPMATREPTLVQRLRGSSRLFGWVVMGLAGWDIFQAYRMGDRDLDREWMLAQRRKQEELEAQGVDPLMMDENLDRKLKLYQTAGLKREVNEAIDRLNTKRKARGEPVLEVVFGTDAMGREQFWRGYLDYAYALIKVNNESGDLNLRRFNAMNGILLRFEQSRSEVPNTALSESLGFVNEEDRVPSQISWELRDVVVLDPASSVRRERMIASALGFESSEFAEEDVPIRLNGGDQSLEESSRLPDLFDEEYRVEEFWPETLRLELLRRAG